MVISVEAAPIDNAILHDYLPTIMTLDEPESGNTHPNTPIGNNCQYHEPHFGMQGGSGEYEDEADKRKSL
jgi:hypothetical protein